MLRRLRPVGRASDGYGERWVGLVEDPSDEDTDVLTAGVATVRGVDQVFGSSMTLIVSVHVPFAGHGLVGQRYGVV